MGISVAKLVDSSYVPFSVDGDQSAPITSVHDGRTDETIDLLLYVSNDDAGKSYTSIKIDFVDYSAPNDIEGFDSGWYIKTSAGDIQPTEAEWAAITAGAEVDISDISGIGVEPFWFRIKSPRGLSVGYKTDVALKLSYTENA